MSWKTLILLLAIYINLSLQKPDKDILLDEGDGDTFFENFGTKFNKSYPDNVYRSKCKESFIKRRSIIKEHNKKFFNGDETYKMGYNRFSDLPEDEFGKMFGYSSYIDNLDIKSGILGGKKEKKVEEINKKYPEKVEKETVIIDKGKELNKKNPEKIVKEIVIPNKGKELNKKNPEKLEKETGGYKPKEEKKEKETGGYKPKEEKKEKETGGYKVKEKLEKEAGGYKAKEKVEKNNKKNPENKQKEDKNIVEQIFDFLFGWINNLVNLITPLKSTNEKRTKRSLFGKDSEGIITERKNTGDLLLNNVFKVLLPNSKIDGTPEIALDKLAFDLGIKSVNPLTETKKNEKEEVKEESRKRRSIVVKSEPIHGDNVFEKNWIPVPEIPLTDTKLENKESRKKRDATDEIPPYKDWRKDGAVTKVFDQGSCAGTWSFAVVSALESHYFLKYKKLFKFSSQQVLDCAKDYGSQGCYIGNMYTAYKYLENNGTGWESKYPFKAKDGKCYEEKITKRVKIQKHIKLQDEEEILKTVATVGPVSVGIDARYLQLYETGIYQKSNCGTTVKEMNHAVTIVGYGKSHGIDYWLCKNSWGSDWGENGYFRIIRGKNMCGIGLIGRYPVL